MSPLKCDRCEEYSDPEIDIMAEIITKEGLELEKTLNGTRTQKLRHLLPYLLMVHEGCKWETDEVA